MIARSKILSRALGSLFVLVAAGCGGGPALRAAETGDLEAARRALAAGDGGASMDAGAARSIAHAMLAREVEQARGDEGIRRIRELGACASAIDDALQARSDKPDDVGAVAALLRFQARLSDHDELTEKARERLASPGAATTWRAALSRGLVTPEEAAERRKLFTDGDEVVRLAALQASFDAFDPGDLEALLEAARLDPHPPARLAAIDAAGSIGGERAVLALKDQFVQANEEERLAIVGAWSTERSFDVGGRDELARTAETTAGPVGLAAAAVLVRHGGAGKDEAAAVLARAITKGATRERVFAIQAAMLDDAGARKAILDAQADPDADVALAALGRSLELYPAGGDGARPKERALVTTKMMGLAKGTSTRALLARAALARAGVREVLPMLVEDARAEGEQARKAAGTSLVVLGEFGRAARLAVDPDVRVRTGVACAMLRAN